MHAAERLLAETGDEDSVSIRAIAQAVGCTPPAIYLHFADKTELLRAVCDRDWDDFNRRLEEAMTQAADPLDRIRMAGRAYVQWGRENPEQYRILFMSRPVQSHTDPVHEGPPPTSSFWRLVEAAAAAMEAGQIVAGDPFFVAVGLWSTVHGVASLVVSNPSFPWPDVDAWVTHVMEAHLRGLAPPIAPPEPGNPVRSGRPRPRPGGPGPASPA